MPTHKNEYIVNPNTGTTTFGTVPEIPHPQYCFPEGEIILRYGEHRGPHRGWGLCHLWQEHAKQISVLGYETKEDAASYVIGDEAYIGEGTLYNSEFLNGLSKDDGIRAAIEKIEGMGLGQGTVQYRLRDWGVSRQRYWGCPIPVIHCDDCGVLPVPDFQTHPLVIALRPIDASHDLVQNVPFFLDIPWGRHEDANRSHGLRCVSHSSALHHAQCVKIFRSSF